MSNEAFADPRALAQQLMSAAQSLSDEEAAQRYQQILAQLPPNQAAELNALALSQVRSTDRRSLAAKFRRAHNDPNSPFDGYDYDDDKDAATPMSLGRMSARAQQQDPNLLGGIFGPDSKLGGQIGKAALAALAALLIRRMMSGQGREYGQAAPAGAADPLGSILGGLLGGGSTSGAADPLGSILGGLLGGSAGGQPVPQRGQPMPGGDLGSILGGLLGGGDVAQQIPQGRGDLGSILDSILSGGAATPDKPGAGSHRKEGLRVRDKQ